MSDINLLSIDELLDLLDDSDSYESLVSKEKSVNKFIRENGIISGQIKVPTYVIYYHYKRKWKLQAKKLSKIAFFREFNKLFDQVRTKNTRYYLLNDGIFNLDKESLDEAKGSDKRYEKKTKKQKESK